MKDGIYAVEVNDGGRIIVVQGEVKNGIFRGLGCIAHLTGLFMADAPSVETGEPLASDAAGPQREVVERPPSPIDLEQASSNPDTVR